MKAQSLNWRIPHKRGARSITGIWLNTRSVLRVILLLLAVILPAAAVSITTIWAISSGGLTYVSATFWAAGFVFLALMLDAENRKALVYAVTGLALMALAWLSSRVAPEFGVLAGFLLAAWAAAPLVSCLAIRKAATEDSL